MNAAALTQFLIDVTRGHQAGAFRENREQVIGASGLPQGIQAALLGQDMALLWKAGAHPMALLYFARACGWDGERYYGCISSAGNSR